MDVAYAELGNPDDPPVVLLHDVGTVGTSREFAEVATPLAEDHHVLAPDLPGYGRSDRPPLSYSASFYEAFVGDFVSEVPDDAAVIATGVTGTYAALAAPEAPVDELVAICPRSGTGGRSLPVRTAIRTPVLGTAAYNALTSSAGLGSITFATDFAREPPGDYLEYCWRSAHQPGARYAPASYLGGALDPAIDVEEAVGSVEAPVSLLWGRESRDPSLSDGRALAEATDSKLVVVDSARRLPHVEHPSETLEALQEAVALQSA